VPARGLLQGRRAPSAKPAWASGGEDSRALLSGAPLMEMAHTPE